MKNIYPLTNNIKKALSLSIVICCFLITNAQTVNRTNMEIKYQWNLEDIYSSDEAWTKAFQDVKDKTEILLQLKGKLGTSAKNLYEFLTNSSNVNKEFTRVYCYASMKSDQDTREAKYLAKMQELSQSIAVIGSKLAFMNPEILDIGKAKIDEFKKEEPGLKTYSMYFDNLFRNKEHLLSEPEEKLLAQASVVLNSPSSIHNIFTNAEFPYPKVILSDKSEVILDQAGYSKYRALADRNDRELVFNTFWKEMGLFQKTLAQQLFAQVNTDIFTSKARHYNSSLESALHEFNVPVEVYHSLVDNVNKNLPTFHRYLKLRKRMMNLDTLKYSDMYAPVVKDLDVKFDFDQAHELVVKAMEPLGKPYQELLSTAKTQRWIDVYPTTGKRSGAYSNGSVYDVHPYVLLNYNNQYNDVSTYAHEMGHALHSYSSNKKQLYPNADYSIFVAEVASTFNEALLNEYMVKNSTDDNNKISLLMERLDGFKGTLFRQTQFAEFELAIHEKAEAGEPLSNEILNNLYGDILRKYYGTKEGICVVDDLYSLEWSYIPHFYYNFYVYQYATSFTASSALAEKVLNHEAGSVEKYMQFISSGCTKYPIDLLKDAGVDMTTNEPFDRAITSMNKLMDEIEALLKKQGK